MLVFDLTVIAMALAQFEHSSEVLVFDLGASPEATVQFEQATEVDEAFLERCLCLCLDYFVVAFSHAKAAVLPLNMIDIGLHQMVSLVVGGCYEPWCDALPQPLTLADRFWTHVALDLAEALRPWVDDAFVLIEAFVGLCELLDL